MRMYVFFGILPSLVLASAAYGMPPVECDTTVGGTYEREVLSFKQEMTVSMARGDVQRMADLYRQIYGYADEIDAGASEPGLLYNCSNSSLGQLCDFECFEKLAAHLVFSAGNLQYYFSVAQSEPALALTLGELAREAQMGLVLLNRAEAVLPLTEAGDDFSDFISKRARFNLMRIRLHMAAGDIHYQSLSEYRIKRLGYLIEEALDGTGSDNLPPEYQKAGVYYERALSLMNEAMVDLPDVGFSGLHNEAQTLQRELFRRLDSLERGYLFVGIDPDNFSNLSLASIDGLLNEVGQEIATVEARIESMIRDWSAAKAGRDVQEVNEHRAANQTRVSLSSYKMAKLESASREMANTIEQAQGKIEGAANEFDRQKKLQEIKYLLTTKVRELQHRKTLIALKRQDEVLSFDLEAAQTQLSDIRWLMNWRVTRANLDVQLSSIASEREELNRQVLRNRSQIGGLKKEVAEVETQRQIHEAREAFAIEEKASIALRRHDFKEARHRVFDERICGVEQELAFMGGSPTAPHARVDGSACLINVPQNTELAYLQGMCGTDAQPGLRLRLQQHQIETGVVLLKCLIGDDPNAELIPQVVRDDLAGVPEFENAQCPNGAGGLGQLELVQDLRERQKEVVRREIERLQARRNAAQTILERLTSTWSDVNRYMGYGRDVLQVLDGAVQFASTLQTVETSSSTSMGSMVCSMGCSSITLNTQMTTTKPPDPYAVALGALRATQHAFDSGTTAIQRRMAYEQNKEEVEAELALLNSQLEDYDEGGAVAELERQEFLRTYSEMVGDTLVRNRDLQELLLQREAVVLDCNQQATSYQQAVASLQNRHQALRAELNLALRENDVLQREEARQELARLTEVAEQEKLDLRRERLENQVAALEADTEIIEDKLLVYSDDRRRRVEALRDGLDALADDAEILAATRDQIQQARLELGEVLTQEEREHLEEAIAYENYHADAIRPLLNELSDTVGDQISLRGEILAFEAETLGLIQEERDAILQRLPDNIPDQQCDASDGACVPLRRLYMAAEGEMALLTKGVPYFVAAKARSIEAANRYLGLLRNRVRTLVSLTDANFTFDGEHYYVRTYDEFESVRRDVLALVRESERPVITQTSVIRIPPNSGFAQELATNRTATLEISPFAQTGSQGLGRYAVWRPEFEPDGPFGQQLVLLDLRLEASVRSDQGACTSQPRFLVVHSGSGWTFESLSREDNRVGASFVSMPSRADYPPGMWANDAHQNQEDEFHAFWSQRHYLNSFPPSAVPGSTAGILPLAGLPLAGRYTFMLPGDPDVPQDCRYRGETLWLHFAYTMKDASEG